MPRLPKAREAIRVALRLGFIFSRQKGSHAIYRHIDGRRLTIPIHGSKELGTALFKQITEDMGITRDKFWNLV
ncbi:MAG: type II toxin-antitoxin system HicA family toxin [Candidatus Sungbacteria bacterium]|uniref:Type II toxin-antitoxin system HicA family toxin n=1 Tax=Candidatus Sungiibacteriota bacterium TaxID=2750080 RepID=A0A9D6LPN9_9BACT|nr:type II toxin-antitoxin system HicA family toxin [Candidatus Sungbacteria bacterium]